MLLGDYRIDERHVQHLARLRLLVLDAAADQLISASIDSSGLASASLTAFSVALTKRFTRSGFFSTISLLATMA